jgi:hypothetical protein
MDLCTLAERVAEKYDPDELVDLLRLTSKDLLRAFPHRLALLRDTSFASECYWEHEEEGEDNEDE